MSFPTNLRLASISMVVLVALGASIAFAAPPAKPAAAAKPGAAAKPAAAPGKGNPTAGKAIYTVKCVACHKPDGSGGVKLTGNPTPNWKDPKVWADPKRKNVDAFMRDCITNGKLPSGMVAWGKTGQLKPADIENVIAYIHVLAKR